MSELPISQWVEQARRDDWHMTFAGSDIRQMLSEVIRLQAINDGLVEALDKCRAIIKFHTKPGNCCAFTPDGTPFSALEAHNEACAAIAKARGGAA